MWEFAASHLVHNVSTDSEYVCGGGGGLKIKPILETF